MGKKNKKGGGGGSTIENRVYLFKDLAAAFLAEHGAMLGSTSANEQRRGRRALAEIARASCIVADTEDLSAGEVAELVASEPKGAAKTTKPAKKTAPAPATGPAKKKPRRRAKKRS
jgi:hypothetical protein